MRLDARDVAAGDPILCPSTEPRAKVVRPDGNAEMVDAVRAGGTNLDQRRDLAARAFAHTSEYDRAVAVIANAAGV